jgi:hypothetical protein
MFHKSSENDPKLFTKLNSSKLMFGKNNKPITMNTTNNNFMGRDDPVHKNDLELSSHHYNGKK